MAYLIAQAGNTELVDRVARTNNNAFIRELASDPELMAAEKMAIAEIYSREPQRGLVEDVQREAQVVAGMNYRFTVKMSGQNSYRVVVFRPLDGEMMVTSFEKLSGS